MKSLVKGIAILGLAAAMTLAAGAQERKVQFAATLGAVFGDEDDVGTSAGLGGRVDFKLARSFAISPEFMILLGEFSGLTYWSCTLDYRFGNGFVGLGPAVLGAVESPLMVKFQGGFRGRHLLVAGSFHTGGDTALAGLTVGYIF